MRQSRQRIRQLWKRLCDLVPRARKEFHFTASDMRLRPDAVVFVLHRGLGKIAQAFFRRLDRTRQHEPDRMKHPHLRLCQLAFRCEAQRLANISQQHVSPLNFCERAAIRSCNRILHQALLQADPHVPSHDLHDVLGLKRSRARQQIAHQHTLRRRPPCRRDPRKKIAHL